MTNRAAPPQPEPQPGDRAPRHARRIKISLSLHCFWSSGGRMLPTKTLLCMWVLVWLLVNFTVNGSVADTDQALAPRQDAAHHAGLEARRAPDDTPTLHERSGANAGAAAAPRRERPPPRQHQAPVGARQGWRRHFHAAQFVSYGEPLEGARKWPLTPTAARRGRCPRARRISATRTRTACR